MNAGGVLQPGLEGAVKRPAFSDGRELFGHLGKQAAGQEVRARDRRGVQVAQMVERLGHQQHVLPRLTGCAARQPVGQFAARQTCAHHSHVVQVAGLGTGACRWREHSGKEDSTGARGVTLRVRPLAPRLTPSRSSFRHRAGCLGRGHARSGPGPAGWPPH